MYLVYNINQIHQLFNESEKTICFLPNTSLMRSVYMLNKQTIERKKKTKMETFFYHFLSNETEKKRYLRNEHNTNGDSSHKINLKILTPFIYPNPTITRNQELNPFKPRHSSKLRRELRNRDIRR